MLKQALRLRLLGLGAICALFAACENTPSNLKQPLVAVSGFSFYDDPLSYINNVRAKSGLNYFAQNEILNISALNHAKYVVANEAMSHDESPGKPNFTGENPSKRAFYAGYNAVVSEIYPILKRSKKRDRRAFKRDLPSICLFGFCFG